MDPRLQLAGMTEGRGGDPTAGVMPDIVNRASICDLFRMDPRLQLGGMTE